MKLSLFTLPILIIILIQLKRLFWGTEEVGEDKKIVKLFVGVTKPLKKKFIPQSKILNPSNKNF